MTENPTNAPRYGTWIRTRRVAIFWLLAVAGLALGVLGLVQPWLAVLSLLGLPFAYIAVVVTLTAHRFGPKGGDWQGRIHELVIDRAMSHGRVLDVGCGSGRLIIRLAMRYPGTNGIGLDQWGADWEYSQAQCESNAALEGVGPIEFVRGSAAALPFDDGSVDCGRWRADRRAMHDRRIARGPALPAPQLPGSEARRPHRRHASGARGGSGSPS